MQCDDWLPKTRQGCVSDWVWRCLERLCVVWNGKAWLGMAKRRGAMLCPARLCRATHGKAR